MTSNLMLSSPLGRAGTSPTVWCATDIQQMMYVFGDVKRPLQESVLLVEKVTRQQMLTVLLQAVDVAVARGARYVGIEDFLFLLRKDKVKLRRLIRYLEMKDMKTSLVKGGEDGDDSQDPGESRSQMRKRKKICHDFLSGIDQTGELLAIFEDSSVDEIKHQRLMRADLLTRNMDSQEYMEFSSARQANYFRKHKFGRLRDWLMTGLNVDVKPSIHGLEILAYLAYETIAQIIDLSLIVKRDMSAKIDDPVEQVLPPILRNHDLEPSITTEPSTPTQTPPQTPTSPLAGSLGGPPLPGSIQPPAKKQKRLRKKSGVGDGAGDFTTASAITPAEIREVMRRYSQQVGPFAVLSKYPTPNVMKRIVSCRIW